MVKMGNGVGGNRAVNSGGIHRSIPLKYLVLEVFKLPPTLAEACGTFAWISPSRLCIVVQQLQRSPRKYFNKTIGYADSHELRTKGSAIRIRPGAPVKTMAYREHPVGHCSFLALMSGRCPENRQLAVKTIRRKFERRPASADFPHFAKQIHRSLIPPSLASIIRIRCCIRFSDMPTCASCSMVSR